MMDEDLSSSVSRITELIFKDQFFCSPSINYDIAAIEESIRDLEIQNGTNKIIIKNWMAGIPDNDKYELNELLQEKASG